jgi:ATP-dependent DNA helicase PIF1
MLLKNQPNSDLVNGSCGVVVEFKKLDGLDVPLLQGKDVKCALSPETMMPVVRFANGATVAIGMDVFKVESPVAGGHDRARREQLPIRLAWAITVHKDQGMTIEYLQVDLRSVFEPGHAYVALSRAKSIEGLHILSFDPKKCWCDPKVVEFYRIYLCYNEEPPTKKLKIDDEAETIE